ncbi:MAG TPA: hypothetical protein VMX12_02530 [Acidimicrobiia bacterium]|nr:hypothetical protein [Acidimicrobiia bacterium]
MDAPTVGGRAKRTLRIDLDPECLNRLAEAAEEHCTTPKLWVEKTLVEMYPPPPEVD